MKTPQTMLRVGRSTKKFDAVERFYRDGLGFYQLGRFRDRHGADGMVLGLPTADYHLVVTHSNQPMSTESADCDHSIVVYIPDNREWQAAVDRIRKKGHRAVPSFNTFWDKAGVAFEDPDGCQVILLNASREEGQRTPKGYP